MVYNSISFLSKLKTMLCIVTQSYPTLHDPLDCSSPGSSIHRVFQARILEWVFIFSSRGSSRTKDQIAGSFFTCWAIKEAQQILDKSHCRYRMISHIYVESKKVQQTSEYNKKEADSQIQRTNYGLLLVGTEEQYRSESVQFSSFQFSSVTQSCSTLCHPMDCSSQASLSITNSLSLLKLVSIESVMPSNHLILCRPLLLPLSIFPSIRVFSNQTIVLKIGSMIYCMTWET